MAQTFKSVAEIKYDGGNAASRGGSRTPCQASLRPISQICCSWLSVIRYIRKQSVLDEGASIYLEAVQEHEDVEG